MSEAVFERCLPWLQQFDQPDIHLNGFGEPLLHPRLAEYVSRVQSVVPLVTFATNGLLLTPAMARNLKALDIWYVTVSGHAPLQAQRAVCACIAVGLKTTGCDPARGGRHNWAGQVDVPVTLEGWRPACTFLRDQTPVVLSDGRLVACCIDAEGISARGTVFDDIAAVTFEPFELCDACHHHRV